MKTLRKPSRGGGGGPIALFFCFTAALASTGCTEKACLEWSTDRGACPSREEALKRFGGQSCVADIKAVVTDAELNDDACCYEVEKRGSGEPGCGAVGAGPTGGSPSNPTPCGGCASFLSGSASDICVGSDVLFNDLVACLCTADGACSTACNDGSCANPFDNQTCNDCASDTAMGCGNQLNACMNDP